MSDVVGKDTNPKDAVGTKKPPHSTVSQAVMAEVGVAMLEGARRYGRHNYRESGVRASVYYDATRRHLDSWWEGQDIDPDSGLHHVTKAIASLTVLRDAMIQDLVVDDRPPETPEWHKEYLQQKVNEIFERIPEAKAPVTRKRQASEEDVNSGNLVRFVLNGREMSIEKKKNLVSYDDISLMAGIVPPHDPTITYSSLSRQACVLLPGHTLVIGDGCVINCWLTGNA